MSYLERFFEPKGWQSGKFTNKDGKQIRYGHVEPAGEKKGTVVLTTGYADLIESYDETIREFTSRGYAVWAMDWAGQGGSDKKITADEKERRLEDHIHDLEQFRRDIVKADDTKPVIMSTHSMGGQIGLHYLQRHPEDFDFALVAAPFIDFELGPLARAALKGIFRTAVELGFGDQDLAGARKSVVRHMSSLHRKKKETDKDAIRIDLHRTFMMLNGEKRAEDPTLAMIDSLFDSTAKMNEETFLKSIQAPVLIGAAEHDETINNEAIKRAAALLPQAKYVFLKDASHGVWTERKPVREEWWRHVDGFLKEQHARFDSAPAKAAKPPAMKGP